MTRTLGRVQGFLPAGRHRSQAQGSRVDAGYAVAAHCDVDAGHAAAELLLEVVAHAHARHRDAEVAGVADELPAYVPLLRGR